MEGQSEVQLTELKTQRSGPELNHIFGFAPPYTTTNLKSFRMDLGWVGWEKEINFKVDFKVDFQADIK